MIHFTFCSKPIYPVTVTCARDGYGSNVGEIFLPFEIELWSGINRTDETPSIMPDRWVFQYRDVAASFGEFWARWSGFCSVYEEAMNCYVSTIYHHLPQSTELLALTQALEAYHGQRYTSHSVHDFRGKLLELLRNYESELHGLVANLNDFADSVRDNRNYYTHHNPRWLQAGRVVRGAELIRMNERLKILFQMCVLSEIGIPASRFVRLRRQVATRIVDFDV